MIAVLQSFDPEGEREMQADYRALIAEVSLAAARLIVEDRQKRGGPPVPEDAFTRGWQDGR